MAKRLKIKVFWNFCGVTLCVFFILTNNCDARRSGGGSRGSSRGSGGGWGRSSRPSYSRPAPSPSYTSHPAHTPIHSAPPSSHISSAPPSYGWSTTNTKPSSHIPSAPPSYSTISKNTNVGHSSNPPHPPPAYSPRAPQIPSAPKAPVAPPAYNPSYGWKITPTNAGTGTGTGTIDRTHLQHSGYGRPVSNNWQTSSSNPAHNGINSGLNSGLNYPRQQYTQPNQHNAPSFTNQNHFPSHQPTVVNNFVTNNHHSNIHTPSYSPPAYHFVSYNHYPSTYYSPFHDYYPIILAAHLHSHSHLGYGGYNDHHHYHHHTYTNTAPATTATTVTTMGNTNTNPNNSGPNQNNNNIPNASGSYQNTTIRDGITHKPDPFERSQPLIYTIPAQNIGGNDTDSTEIIFTNPYLIVGVENVLFYGEFHDDEDTMIYIDQGSDGSQPVQPSQKPNYKYADANLTSTTSTLVPPTATTTTTATNTGT